MTETETAAKSRWKQAVNVHEFEELARESLSKMAYDYYSSGSNDEVTVKENVEAFRRLRLWPRMLQDVTTRDMEVTVLGGQNVSMPIMIAPTAFHRLADEQGELATIKAAVSRDTIMVLSTLATSSIEDVAALAKGNLWFQLYVYRDKNVTASLVKRAEEAGCKALVLTVDSPILGRRERDVRNGFALPPGLTVKNLIQANLQDLPEQAGSSGLAEYIASLYSQAITWKDVEWLKSITKMPLLLKGILRADDARLAIEHGASGIIVSNHGGRQLDTVPATITCLPRIVEAAGDQLEVYLDGGIRRGTDVLKAMALGARGIFVGRPILWGLAAGGQAGAERVLDLLRAELDLAMALAGVSSLNAIPRDLVEP